MKFSCPILFLLLFCSCISTKGIYNRNKKTMSLINEAELSIVDNDLSKANFYYRKALFNKGIGFADDYYSALKVSVDVKDTIFAYFCSDKLADKGFCKSFFEEIQILKSDSLKWKKLVNTLNTKPHFNSDYRDNLYNLFNEDQLVRQQGDRSKIVAVDSLNFIQFKDLIKKYGYPTEEKIGVECTESKGIKPSPFEIPLRHFAQHHFNGIDTLLESFLFQKVLTPKQYAYHTFCLNKEKTNFFPSPIVFIDDNYYTYKFTAVQKINVDKKRKEIGLSTLDDLIKKIEFSIKSENNSDRYRLCLHSPIEMFGNISPSLKEKILKKFTKIDF